MEPDWPPAPPSTILSQWIRETQEGVETPIPDEYGFQQRPDPCQTCSAWCCTRLNFPHTTPTVEANLEYLRFLIGFEGMELGFSPEGWTAVVRTKCRHRASMSENGRCDVYDQPERPLACQTYQPAVVHIKLVWSHPTGILPTDDQSLDDVLALYRLDEQGTIRSHPQYHQVHTRHEWVEETRKRACFQLKNLVNKRVLSVIVVFPVFETVELMNVWAQ